MTGVFIQAAKSCLPLGGQTMISTRSFMEPNRSLAGAPPPIVPLEAPAAPDHHRSITALVGLVQNILDCSQLAFLEFDSDGRFVHSRSGQQFAGLANPHLYPLDIHLHGRNLSFELVHNRRGSLEVVARDLIVNAEDRYLQPLGFCRTFWRHTRKRAKNFPSRRRPTEPCSKACGGPPFQVQQTCPSTFPPGAARGGSTLIMRGM